MLREPQPCRIVLEENVKIYIICLIPIYVKLPKLYEVIVPKLHWPSPPVIAFFPISKFSYKLVRFLINSSIIKSDNEIGKFSY